MSVSAASSGYTDPNQFVPTFASENATRATEQKQKDAKHLTVFAESDDEPSFWDLLDVINPLQHIPVVNTLYQELTGDKIGVGARLAGGTLFGGAIGLVASAIGCIIEEETGDDIGGHVMALFKDEETAPQLAAQSPAAPPAKATADETKAATAQTAAALPAITLPETTATAPPQSAAAPMMFNADGLVAPPAATSVNTAAATPINTAAAVAKPLPLNAANSQSRYMPTPNRTTHPAEQGPPPVTVPVSNGSNRSNVPVTGRDPLAGRGPDPVAVQKAMSQQGIASGTAHPMLGGAPSPVPLAPSSPAGSSTDWVQAMNQALNKYEKAGNLAARQEKPVMVQ
ncbi:MAG: hypothetical protein FD176_239 [Rhodospirillaceae bacterium]|nr:MAG: hypothetical protein FD176_239 [Rhodospirillaceae bacterium]TNC97512.1 MAG: Uncharacterized protein FD119_1112 [Stygiobacter sp.]